MTLRTAWGWRFRRRTGSLSRRSSQGSFGVFAEDGAVAKRQSDHPAILIHAVSLGEINATRALIEALRQQRPNLHVIVSTTTKTGYDRGQQLYGAWPDVTLIRYPLDFTTAVTRVLDALRPSLVVLMELEVWPNFIRQCVKRGYRSSLPTDG